MDKTKTIRIQLLIDEKADKMLDELAKQEGRNRSEEMRWLIRREYYRTIEPKNEIINT